MAIKLKRKASQDTAITLVFAPEAAAAFREIMRLSPESSAPKVVERALIHYLAALRVVARGGGVWHQEENGAVFEVVVHVAKQEGQP